MQEATDHTIAAQTEDHRRDNEASNHGVHCALDRLVARPFDEHRGE